MKNIIVAPRTHVTSANSMQNMVCTGPAAPTAIAGLAHAIDRELKDAGLPIGIIAGGVVIHSYERHVGMPLMHPLKAGSIQATPPNHASLIDNPQVSFDASFVFLTDVGDDEDMISRDDNVEVLEIVTAMAAEGSFNGGRMARPFRPQGGYETALRLTETEATRRLLERGDGFMLFDESDKLRQMAEARPDGDHWKALVEAVTHVGEPGPDRTREGNVIYIKRRQPGVKDDRERYVPVAVGYAAIEPLTNRVAGRFADAPHAYAEPLTSLGRYSAIDRALVQDNPFAGAFWRYRSDVETGNFVVHA